MENRPSGWTPSGRTLATVVTGVGLGLLGNLITNEIDPPDSWSPWWPRGLWAALGVLIVVTWLLTDVRPEQAARVRRRRLFADSVVSALVRIGEKENWRDVRFAELQAELEVQDDRRRLRRPRGPRRVRSLTRAMRQSRDRLVLLEGEPGAGKSVALRHLALRLGRRAARRLFPGRVVPLYLNLKELRRSGGELSIRDFVIASVSRSGALLAEELDEGMRRGTWLFLFDSFDEIPEILTATEVEPVVEEYADAIHEFLHTMNASRGIVASREFRGPRRFGWPRFTVLRLTTRQKRELIRRARLTAAQESLLLGGITANEGALGPFSDNPMLLGLLTGYVARNGTLPRASHEVFEDFVADRLRRDAGRVRQRFGLDGAAVRSAAEQAAFCMAAEPGLGLSPGHDELAAAVARRFGPRPAPRAGLDALALVRLAGGEDRFSFVHRRFQEFFATALVLRDTSLVSAERLLTDGRWRETAVTLLQTHDAAATTELIEEAGRRLRAAIPARSRAKRFTWPSGVLHLLSVLTAGLGAASVTRIGAPVRALVGRLLRRAYEKGSRTDRMWAIENAALAPDPERDELLDRAAAGPSLMLRETAFAQVGRLRSMTPALERQVRAILIGQAATGRLWRERATVAAGLRRLPEPRPFLQLYGVLLLTPAADALVVATYAALGLRRAGLTGPLVVVATLVETFILLGFLLCCVVAGAPALGSRSARWARVVGSVPPGAFRAFTVIGTLVRTFLLFAVMLAVLPAAGPVAVHLALCFHAYLDAAASPRPIPLRWLWAAPVVWLAHRSTAVRRIPRRHLIAPALGVLAVLVLATGGRPVLAFWSAYVNPVTESLSRVLLALGLLIAAGWSVFRWWSNHRDQRRVTARAGAGPLRLADMRALLTAIETDHGLSVLVRGLRRGRFSAEPDAVEHLRVLEAGDGPYRVKASETTLDEIARLLADRRPAA
ncbi:NACHT domain-containing protein [Actinoplanes siamensis]|uniref:NACHT domain-containing protein n=1 Tax=Actinoplanes siamensis TaxID=1223317 RepID=A0A919N386_9ACTN|nr:NACHT domain-containing protein [Actinoplanes siamensis]GIF03554.1 hypothetical protein Asi03nite_10920 [Actinoplanes siamensis]